MKRNFFLLLTLILIVSVLTSCSWFLHQNKQSSNKACSDSKLELDSKLIHGTLKNGFRYYLYKNSIPENRVNLHLDVLAGSFNEQENQQGLAHYLEHMLFNGSTHFKPGELIEYFQSIGMEFGADANAHTSFFETVYDLSLPHGDRKSLEDALIVINDYAQGALLLESEIDKERGIILAEKRDRDSISYRTFKATLEFELPESRIIKRYPIGITKTINNADKTLLKKFYDTWYRPDNMILVMVGDFDIRVAEQLIKNRFSLLKARGHAKGQKSPSFENSFANHTPGIKTFYHFEPESGATEVSIEKVTRVDFHLATIDDLKKQIKSNIADSILNNRLSRLLSKKDASFSDIGADSGIYLRNISFASIWAKTTPDKWKKTLSLLENNLRSALVFGFTKKELKRAKNEYINMLENRVKTSSTRKNKTIAASIIYHLNNKKVFQDPETRLNILKPFIENLKIKDINKSFLDTWGEESKLVLVTGNSRIGQSRKEARKIILSQYNKSAKIKVYRHKDYKKIDFPYLHVPEKQGKVKTKKVISEIDITTIDFENSVRLNLKQTQFKKEKFLFSMVIKGGKITEPASKPGISIVAEQLLNESGLGRINKEELKDILAGTSVDINFNIKNGYFNFSGEAEPSELNLVFDLVYSSLKDPGFRQESLELIKQRYKQDFVSLSRTPDGLMRIKGDKFLAGGDTRFGNPGVDLIKKITISDIKAWLKPFFEKANLEFSIVGDFDTKQAEILTARYFGTLAKRDNSIIGKISDNQPRFPKGEKLVLNMDTKVDKSQIRLAFLTDDYWDISQTRTLNLLAHIFSEKFRKIIREKLGLAYSTYVYNHPSSVYENFGILHAVVLVNPEQIDLVLKNMEEITISLNKHGVTQKELELVRKPVLNYIKDIQQTNTYWLDSVLTNSLEHPQKLKWAQSMFNDYSSISFKEVSLLAELFLKSEDKAVIVIKPVQ